MSEAVPRLGDMIDDYCPRCKLLLNHSVASFAGDKVAKVICKTCYTEHAYHHAKAPPKKAAGGGRMTLFDQVAAGMPADSAARPGAQKKRKSSSSARYISRHSSRSPRNRK